MKNDKLRFAKFSSSDDETTGRKYAELLSLYVVFLM